MQKKLDEKNIFIVGGAGHVGLPLAIAFANNNLKVTIFDIDKEALKKINSGNVPFKEEGAEKILKKVIGKNLFVENKIDSLKSADIIIVVIGTPVDEYLNPKISYITDFFENVLPYLREDQLIILRSTLYPGTMSFLNNFLNEKKQGIKVAYCPERIAEGKAIEELSNLPQIVSGFGSSAFEMAKELFSQLTDDIVQLSPFEAELAKLFTNSWRYIQFATANQFFMLAEKYNADFYKIYNAMTYKYPRAAGFPSPGFAAGPCLFKDTMQLSAFSENTFFLGHSAMLINEGFPKFIITHLLEKYQNIRDKTVGLLGMAFKAESDDKRDSLSFKLRKLLKIEAKKVLCTDEYINDKSFYNLEYVLENSDIIIIGAPHKKYKNIKFDKDNIIDVWGILR